MNTPTGKLGQYLTTAFDPRYIPGCTLWLDAADRTTLTLSGSNVTSWIDKSGFRRDASGGVSPTYDSNNQCLVFDGSTTLLQGNANYLHNSNDGTWSVFSVALSTASGIRHIINYDTTPNRIAQFLRIESDNTLRSIGFQSDGSTPFVASVGNITLSTKFLGCTVNTTSNITGFFNGTSGTPVSHTANNTLSNTFYEVGVYSTNNTNRIQYWSGNIYEIIIFSNAVTTTQRQAVEGYLAAKWGLTTNLPATHPFKSLPPISRQFAPVDISGCVLWIDAADASTVTLSGNNITQLQDKSSNAYVFATASGFTYNVTKFNGTYPSFYSPTSTNGYSLGSNASFTLNQPFTAFAVGGNLITPASGGYFWDSTSNANRAALLSFSPGRPTMFAGVELFSTNSNSFTGALILTCRYNSTSSSIFENGSNTSSNTNVGTQNAVSLRLGAAWSSTTNWNGHICEILFFNRLVSTAEQQQIEGYLANKWGLRGNLAASHPFKLYSALTPVFTPVQISGLQMWLDGIDPNGNSSVPSNGTIITSWVDKSGNGNTLSNVGNGVTYATATSNISYNGTSYLQRTGMTISSTFTLFAVARKTSGGGPLFTNLQTTDVTGFFPRYTDGGLYITRGDSPPNWGGGTPFTDGITYLYSLTYDTGSNINLWANGALWLTTTQTGGITRNCMVLGKRNVGGTAENWTGTFSEILHYNTTPSTSERQAVEGYLANKWGLVGSLPASHPYKKFIN